MLFNTFKSAHAIEVSFCVRIGLKEFIASQPLSLEKLFKEHKVSIRNVFTTKELFTLQVFFNFLDFFVASISRYRDFRLGITRHSDRFHKFPNDVFHHTNFTS